MFGRVLLGYDCPWAEWICFTAESFALVGPITTVMVIVGLVIGLWPRLVTPDGAQCWVEWLVALALATLLGWDWTLGQGGILWFVGRLGFLLILLILVIGLPATLSVAIFAALRSGQSVRASTRQYVTLFALIPAVYVVVFASGVWPSRTSERSMTAHFHQNAAAFDALRRAMEDGTMSRCWEAGSPEVNRAQVVAASQLCRSVGGYAVKRTDGSIAINYWAIGIGGGSGLHRAYVYTTKPGPIVDGPLDEAPVRWGRGTGFYKPLGGNWYLVYGSD